MGRRRLTARPLAWLLFDPENGGDMHIRNIGGLSPTVPWHCIPEGGRVELVMREAQ
jgi:hypothetical protein